jgi:FlaA1/EpsC-like NDP-sugar epimerase
LSATFLRNRIISALRSSDDNSANEASRSVSQNFIFDNPTIQQLTDAICNLVSPQALSVQRSLTEHIAELVTKYTADLTEVQQKQQPQDRVVLLTGSTGNIGSHILAALLRDQHIAKVYTIDRAVSGRTSIERLNSAFQQRGLPAELLTSSKLSALVGDLNAEAFGLEQTAFDEVNFA